MNGAVALLRGINVGGHKVRMDQLRSLFEELDLHDVRTHISSGNVLFSTAGHAVDDHAGADLERRIEAHLEEALGYAVPTFVRLAGELARLVSEDPVPEGDGARPATQHVAFLREALEAAAQQQVYELADERDDLAFHGRELLCRTPGGFLDSSLARPALVKALGPATIRTMKTVQALASKSSSNP